MAAQPLKTESWKPFSALFMIIALTMAISLNAPLVDAQTSPIGVIGGNIQKRASGVLAMMGYTLTPDVTTGSISISDQDSENPQITMISLGGGATISKSVPLYLEGTASFSRYSKRAQGRIATYGRNR